MDVYNNLPAHHPPGQQLLNEHIHSEPPVFRTEGLIHSLSGRTSVYIASMPVLHIGMIGIGRLRELLAGWSIVM